MSEKQSGEWVQIGGRWFPVQPEACEDGCRCNCGTDCQCGGECFRRSADDNPNREVIPWRA